MGCQLSSEATETSKSGSDGFRASLYMDQGGRMEEDCRASVAQRIGSKKVLMAVRAKWIKTRRKVKAG